MRKLKRICAILLIIILAAAIVPSAYAEEELHNVTIRIYPNSNYATNQTPIVGMVASQIQIKPSCNVSATGYCTDSAGNVYTDKLKYENYTMHISVTANEGVTIRGDAIAAVNNESASIMVTGPQTAEITWGFLAAPIAPTVYHNPTDEKHEIGGVFPFSATCSDPDATAKWYLYDQMNNRNTPEEVQSAYPQMSVYTSTSQNGTAQLTIKNAIEGLDGWSVACSFTNAAGTVWTERAYCKITNATVPTPTPKPTNEIVDPPSGETGEDGLPAGVYIVETPEPEIQVIETPSPEQTPEPVQTEPPVEKKETKPVVKFLKGVGIGVGAIAVLGGAVVGIQYIKDKRRRQRRAEMAKTKGGSYKGKH